MSWQLIVREVLRTGWLKLSQELPLLKAVRQKKTFSPEELGLILELQKALQAGEILIGERKKCVNVVEALVRDAITDELLARGLDEVELPDVGDVAAYALNRLPSAYATTQEGYEEQRARILETASEELRAKVREAIERVIQVPNSRPEGATPLGKLTGAETAEMLDPLLNRLELTDSESELSY